VHKAISLLKDGLYGNLNGLRGLPIHHPQTYPERL